MAPTPNSLKLHVFSDRELLHVVKDCTDTRGDWVRSLTVAEAIGLDKTHTRPKQCVSIRLSYMARKTETLEKMRDQKTGDMLFRLTPLGEKVLSGRIDKRTQDRLDKAEEGELVMLTRYVTSRFQRSSASGATLLRREWSHGTHRERAVV